MREIFPPREPAHVGECFYTIRPEDKGKTVIVTEIGPIRLSDVMGYVLGRDVGKRLYRRRVHIGSTRVEDEFIWQVESDDQRDERTARQDAKGDRR